MWNSQGSDKLFWSEGAKMLLVDLITKYPDSIRDVRGSRKDFDKQKRDAWDLIFNDLLNHGMPSTTLTRVKSIWFKIKGQAIDAQKKWKHNEKTNPMTNNQKAIIDLIELINKESQHLMPMPINIKTEPRDEDDTDDVQSLQSTRNLRSRKSTSAKPNNNTEDEQDNERNHTANFTAGMHANNNNISLLEATNNSNIDPIIRGNLNPVVVLNRIPMKREFGGRMVNEESANYWHLMTKHEQERMAFERDLHRKNLELMDLKIRIEKKKLEAIVPRLFE